jgi:hypothetical protein
MSASSLRWPLFAAIGLIVAIAVALLATNLVSEKIGIASEPITAGESLSPQHAKPHPHRRPARGSTTTEATPNASGPVAGGSSTGASGESDSGGSDSKLKSSITTPASPPASSTPAPDATPPADGGSDTSPEPGDD